MTTVTTERALPPPSLRKSVSELAHDVATMGDLQLKLLAADTRVALERGRRPALAATIGGVLILGAAPILLLAAAWGLSSALAWPMWAACAVVAGGAIVAGSLIAWLGLRGFGASLKPFERSRHEFQENVRWIQRAIRTHGHIDAPPRNPREQNGCGRPVFNSQSERTPAGENS